MRSGTEKNPNPCEAPLGRFLAVLARPMRQEAAAHYRLRPDGSIIRATPKPAKRKPRRPQVYREVRPPRRDIGAAMLAASGKEQERRTKIRAAAVRLGLRRIGGVYVKSELLLIAAEVGLPLSVVRDLA